MQTYFKTFPLLIILVAASGASGSDAIGPGDSDSRWILGGGMASGNNIYDGEGSQNFLYPRFQFNGDRFFIKDGRLSLNVLGVEQWSAGVTLVPHGSFLSDSGRYEDNPKLAGLTKRERTVEGGFYVNYTNETGRLSFSFLTDTRKKHNGHGAILKYVADFTVADWYINPYMGVQWISQDKVDYYFGVSPEEETATRAAYKGEATYNVFAGVRARYDITDHWDFNFETGFNRFGSGLRDSSIVDADYGYYAGFSINYNF